MSMLRDRNKASHGIILSNKKVSRHILTSQQEPSYDIETKKGTSTSTRCSK